MRACVYIYVYVCVAGVKTEIRGRADCVVAREAYQHHRPGNGKRAFLEIVEVTGQQVTAGCRGTREYAYRKSSNYIVSLMSP